MALKCVKTKKGTVRVVNSTTGQVHGEYDSMEEAEAARDKMEGKGGKGEQDEKDKDEKKLPPFMKRR